MFDDDYSRLFAKVLFQRGAHVNARNEELYTTVHSAASMGDVRTCLVRLLNRLFSLLHPRVTLQSSDGM
jgi:hypothetical protein